MNTTQQHQQVQADRADVMRERESQEYGWSLPRCEYPAFRRAYREFYGHDLDIHPLLTDDGSDPAVWDLMEQLDRDMVAHDSAA